MDIIGLYLAEHSKYYRDYRDIFGKTQWVLKGHIWHSILDIIGLYLAKHWVLKGHIWQNTVSNKGTYLAEHSG